MAAGSTDNLSLVTLESNDRSTEAWAKTNWEVVDAYVTATKMTNKSGEQRTAGDVVVADTTADESFTTTTSAASKAVIGVVQESIADDATGIVKQSGIVSQLKVTGATARGAWLQTSTTAGQATSSGVAGTDDPPDGSFAIALSSTVGSGTVIALLITPVVKSTDIEITTYSETVNTVAAAGTTEALDLNAATVHDITLDENVTFTFTNPPASGRAISFTVILRQDGSGTNTVTWPASVEWPGGSAPTITATASAVDIVVFTTVDGGTTYYGNIAGQAYA